MNILSLFDGMSCGQIALERAGIKVDNYYASEIDKHAIKVTMANYPNTIQLGDITKIATKTICLSEVYSYICLKYFNNDLPYLQSIIPEWEMLHRINEEQTFAAYFGTQKSNECKKISENPILSINDSVWFFKCEVGYNKGIFDIIRSGKRRKGSNIIDVSELCKYSFWWNGYGQSKYRVAEKGIEWVNGENSIRGNKTEDKRSRTKTVFNERIKGEGIQENQVANEQPNNETELSCSNVQDRQGCFSTKKIRYRTEKESHSVSNIERELYTGDDDDKITRYNKNILPIYKETQATVVECEWGVIVFKGVFSLVQGGSPCQGFSFAGKMLNFNDPRSKLFFEFVRLKDELNPNWFLLENVKMKKEHEAVISKYLGVRPIRLNSKLVSAQERKRLYWTNIPVNSIPQNKRITLKDILMTDFEWKVDIYGNKKSNQFKASALTGSAGNSGGNHSDMDLVKIPESTLKGYAEVKPGDSVDLTHYGSKTRRGRLMRVKSNCLTAAGFDFFYNNGEFFRRYNPIECERLQTVPDNYTNYVSDFQRYRMLGNGWTVDIIAHLLKHIPQNTTK